MGAPVKVRKGMEKWAGIKGFGPFGRKDDSSKGSLTYL
jgi:hypothetical protein